jgi:hypothetical protein
MGKMNNSNTFKTISLRNLLDKFHVYGGLFIAGYLIMMGISSIYFQHHISYSENDSAVTWEQKINLPAIDDAQKYKQAVRDSLGLFGHTPWWEDFKDDAGIHHFMISRPGKKYWVEVPEKGNLYKIKESRTSFLSVFNALHGLTNGELKGPFFLSVWKFIAQIMNVVFLIVLCITIYYWWVRSLRSYSGWLIAGSFILLSFIILGSIWLAG